MIRIPAKAVYVDSEVYDRKNCRDRLERMLPNIDGGAILAYDEEARRECAGIGKRRHGKDDFGDETVIIFTTFDPKRKGWYYHWRDKRTVFEVQQGFCQSALELNLVDGCVFRCAYCGFGRYVTFSLDVERFMAGLDEVFARYPEQSLYKYSNMTDLPPFEPELDAVPPMVERFSTETHRYLMLFTKSDNVDFLTDLEHNGHTIISWSLTCRTGSHLVDKRAASLDQRIEAMRRMQEAGYIVRARLSPIIPVVNWRDEYHELFRSLFAKVKPDLVTLELLGWMDFGDVEVIIDRNILDPELMAEAEAAKQDLADKNWGPFTQRAHEEIYEFCIRAIQEMSPRTPVSVCHGTPTTWSKLGTLMGMTPENYLCNCGPTSTPVHPLYRQFHGPVTVVNGCWPETS